MLARWRPHPITERLKISVSNPVFDVHKARIRKSVKITTLIERVQLRINAFLFVISDEEIKTTKNIEIGELEVKSAAIFSKKRIQKYQDQVILTALTSVFRHR